jgi:hypothetical protein
MPEPHTERYIDYAADALAIERASNHLNDLLTKRRAKHAREQCAAIIAAATRLYGYCVAVELAQNPDIKVK